MAHWALHCWCCTSKQYCNFKYQLNKLGKNSSLFTHLIIYQVFEQIVFLSSQFLYLLIQLIALRANEFLDLESGRLLEVGGYLRLGAY